MKYVFANKDTRASCLILIFIMFLCLASILISGAIGFINVIKHIDMTPMRIFIEYNYKPFIIMIVSAIISCICVKLLKT